MPDFNYLEPKQAVTNPKSNTTGYQEYPRMLRKPGVIPHDDPLFPTHPGHPVVLVVNTEREKDEALADGWLEKLPDEPRTQLKRKA